MSEDDAGDEGPTRRDTIKYSGTVVGGGPVAGCGRDGSRGSTPTRTSIESVTDIDDGSYSVTMAPMGTVEFDAVPESAYTGLPNTADMAIAAGQSDAINPIYDPAYHGPLMDLFQLEMTAKQLYPDRFGEWPGYVDGEPYPDFPESERLFDRQRVADIINGGFDQ